MEKDASCSLTEPEVLLLGAGYTLSKVGEQLGQSRAVLVCRQLDSFNALKKNFPHVERLDISDAPGLKCILNKYPSIHTIIDGVPPLAEASGVRSVIRAASDKVRHLFYLSTTGVTGVTDGSIVNEETPVSPLTPGAKQRLISENLYYAASKLKVTVFRLPAIYGIDRGTHISLLNGRYPYFLPERWSNRIFVDDLVQLLIKAIESREGLPSLFYAGDREPAKTADVVKAYCEALNISIPEPVTTGKIPDTMKSSQRVDSSLVFNTLNINPAFPSYRDFARYLKQEHSF